MRHLAIIAGLVVLSCLVQAVLVQRATVPALDAVRFVELAQRIDAQGLGAMLRQEREPPLFPAWVWLVHEGLERITGKRPWAWASSVQLAAAIPLVLAVVPVYFISLRLIGPSAALAGAMLFCVLPEACRLGAAGLADSTHLCFFCMALWAVLGYFGVGGGGSGVRGQGSGDRGQGAGREQGTGGRVSKEALGGEVVGARFAARSHGDLAPPPLPCPAPPEDRNPWWLLVAGVLMALAVLVRTEALVLPGALVIALAGFQVRFRWRQSWPRLAAAVGCLGFGCAVVILPYLVAANATSPRAGVARVLGRPHAVEPAGTPEPAAAVAVPQEETWRLADGEPTSFAAKETTISLRRRGYASAAVQLADELAEAFAYVVGALALFGLWRLRGRLVRPEDRFAQLYCLLFLLAALHFTAKEGYLSARHLMTVVVLGIGLAGYGALDLGRSIARRRRAEASETAASDPGESVGGSYPAAAWVVVLLAAVVSLSRSVGPLHARQQGHRLAGEWLAQHADVPGHVLDTRGWTGLYSGRTTYRYDRARAAFGDPRLAYVVVERRELDYDSRRSRTLEHLLQVGAQPAAVFSGPKKDVSGQGTVLVYRWDPARLAQWLAHGSLRESERPTGRRDRDMATSTPESAFVPHAPRRGGLGRRPPPEGTPRSR